jgi:hypothetical protein
MSDKEKYDIEEILRRFGGGPGPEVKRAVLERCHKRFGRSGIATKDVAFWKKPVPLYLAAAAVLAALILAVPIQYRLLPHSERWEPQEGTPQTGAVTEAADFEWESAPSDLI